VVRFLPWLVIAATAAHAQPSSPARFLDPTARDRLERARTAVLGGRALDDLRSLVLKGRLRVGVSRDQAVDGQVEIRVLLPDRYLRVDTINGAERRSGFAGRGLLTAKGELSAERANFVRLMLGLAAYVPVDPQLTFESTGEAAFADTVAIDVIGPAFAARVVFDGPSHIPLRLVYDSRNGAGTVMSFANRRDVDGVALPSRVTTLVADRVLETLMFDEMHVNADLRASDFRK
jgi:hypothetical protein